MAAVTSARQSWASGSEVMSLNTRSGPCRSARARDSAAAYPASSRR